MKNMKRRSLRFSIVPAAVAAAGILSAPACGEDASSFCEESLKVMCEKMVSCCDEMKGMAVDACVSSAKQSGALKSCEDNYNNASEQEKRQAEATRDAMKSMSCQQFKDAGLCG